MDILTVTRIEDAKLKVESVAVLPGKGSLTTRGAAATGHQPSSPHLVSSSEHHPSSPLSSSSTDSSSPKSMFIRPSHVSHALYIGTNDGCVTHYSVTLQCITHNDPSKPPPENVGFYFVKDAQQAHKRDLGLGKYSVQYLHADATLNRLVCLCDGTVRMLSATLDHVPTFSSVKQLDGVSLMAVAEKQEHGVARLVALVRKSLVCIEYSENTAGPYVSEEPHPITVGDTSVTQLAWHHGVIIVGGRREYTIYDAKTHQLLDQIVFEKSAIGPMLKVVRTGEGSRVACRIANAILLYDGKTKAPLETAERVEFSEEPLTVSFAYPYLVALDGAGQQMQLSRFDNKPLPPPPSTDARIPGAKGEASLRGFSYVVTSKEIYVLATLPHIKQVGRFIMAGQFGRAVAHFERTYIRTAHSGGDGNPSSAGSPGVPSFARHASFVSTSDPRLNPGGPAPSELLPDDVVVEESHALDRDYQALARKVHQACGLEAFARGQDEVAFMHFEVSDPDPTELLELYPELLVEDGQLSAEQMQTRDRSRSVVMRRRNTIFRGAPPRTGAGVFSGLFTRASDQQQLGAAEDSDASRHLSPQPEHLRREYQLLYDFLKRRRVQSEVHTHAERVVDQAMLLMLIRELVRVEPGDIDALFLPTNALDFDRCRDVVADPMRPRFYTLLLATSGRHAEALQFCKQHQLVDEAVVPLQLSSDLALFAEHFPWMVVTNCAAAVKAVASPLKNPPPPNLVLSILGGSTGQPLRLYLTHVIERMRSKEERVHTLHATNLIKMVSAIHRFSGAGDAELCVQPGQEPGLLGELRAELLAFLRRSSFYDSDAVLAALQPTRLLEEQAAVFSRDDDHISVLQILVYKLRSVARAEEYCISKFEEVTQKTIHAQVAAERPHLGRDGGARVETIMMSSTSSSGGHGGDLLRHKASTLLGDSTTAVKHSKLRGSFRAAETHSNDGDLGSRHAPHGAGVAVSSFASVASAAAYGGVNGMEEPSAAGAGHQYNEYFTLLVKVLLVPPAGHTQLLEDAIRILDLHARDVNPISVLKSLPSDVRIPAIAPFLKRTFQTLSHKKSLMRVEHSLAESVHAATERQRSLLHQRCVYVDDDRPCVVCQKRLSDAVIGVFPNLKVAHFRCFKDKDLDPERGVPFTSGDECV